MMVGNESTTTMIYLDHGTSKSTHTHCIDDNRAWLLPVIVWRTSGGSSNKKNGKTVEFITPKLVQLRMFCVFLVNFRVFFGQVFCVWRHWGNRMGEGKLGREDRVPPCWTLDEDINQCVATVIRCLQWWPRAITKTNTVAHRVPTVNFADSLDRILDIHTCNHIYDV